MRGSVKMVKNGRFEIPEKLWHGFCVIGVPSLPWPSLEEGRRRFGWNSKKTEAGADGISNRRIYTIFIPPLTKATEVERALQMQLFARFRRVSFEDWVAAFKNSRELSPSSTQYQEQYQQAGWPSHPVWLGRRLWQAWIFHPLWQLAWSYQDELLSLQHCQNDLEVFRAVMERPSVTALKRRLEDLENSFRPPAADWRFYHQLPPLKKLFHVPAGDPEQISYRIPLLGDWPTMNLVLSQQKSKCPYPWFIGGWLKVYRALTWKEMVVTACALKRYELRHQRLPSNLNLLIPDFLDRLPLDLMDGQRLRYRLNADGIFTLYSVGDNGKDDGGVVGAVPAGKKSYSSADELDPIWPLAVPEE